MAEKYNHQEEIKKLEAIKGKTLDEILKDAKPSAGADIAKMVFKHFGVRAPDGIEAMFIAKGDRIEKNIVRKENAIVEAAIRRDAVIFTNVEYGSRSFETALKDSQDGKTVEMILKELRQKWEDYFRSIY